MKGYLLMDSPAPSPVLSSPSPSINIKDVIMSYQCLNWLTRYPHQLGWTDDRYGGISIPLGNFILLLSKESFTKSEPKTEREHSPTPTSLIPPPVISSPIILPPRIPEDPEPMDIETPWGSDDEETDGGFLSDCESVHPMGFRKDNKIQQPEKPIEKVMGGDELSALLADFPHGDEETKSKKIVASQSFATPERRRSKRLLQKKNRLLKIDAPKEDTPKITRPRRKRKSKKTKPSPNPDIPEDVAKAAKEALKNIPIPLREVKCPPREKIRVYNLPPQKRKGPRGYMGSPYEQYQCNIQSCSAHKKPFENEKSYKAHMKKHIKQYPKQCSICFGMYKDWSKLTYHLNGHAGLRPYKCKVEGCDYTFRWDARLRDHYSKHTNEPRYGCKFCKERFQKFNQVQRHALDVHKRKIKVQESDEKTRSEPSRNTRKITKRSRRWRRSRKRGE